MQAEDDVLRGLPAQLRRLRQARANQVVEPGRRGDTGGGQRGRLGLEDLRDEARLGGRLEGLVPGDHLVKHGAEREDVAPEIGLVPLELLGRYVLQRAGDGAVACEIGCLVVPSDCAAVSSGRGFAMPKSSSFAPLFVRMTFEGFEIAMDDAGRVRRGERAGHLDAVAERLIERQPAAREPARERLALEELHDQEVGAVLLADVEERADVRVTEARDDARLTRQALPRGQILRAAGRQDLDRDSAIEPGIEGFVDLAHAAGADQREDFVGTELVAGLQWHAGKLAAQLYSLNNGRLRVSFDRGSRIGPYEIICLLGAGGRGEVYRGRDPRLGRDVAVQGAHRRCSGG